MFVSDLKHAPGSAILDAEVATNLSGQVQYRIGLSEQISSVKYPHFCLKNIDQKAAQGTQTTLRPLNCT